MKSTKLDAWGVRIRDMAARLAAHEADVREYVTKWVDKSTKYLNEKQEKVDKLKRDVDALMSELGCTAVEGCFGEALRSTRNNEIIEHVAKLRDDLKTREEALKERVDRNAKARKKLVDTITKGNSVGEETRFHRIVENWELCEINPGHPKCKEPIAKKAAPSVHIVVETKNYNKNYPHALAADENAAGHSAIGGVVKSVVVKKKQK